MRITLLGAAIAATLLSSGASFAASTGANGGGANAIGSASGASMDCTRNMADPSCQQRGGNEAATNGNAGAIAKDQDNAGGSGQGTVQGGDAGTVLPAPDSTGNGAVGSSDGASMDCSRNANNPSCKNRPATGATTGTGG